MGGLEVGEDESGKKEGGLKGLGAYLANLTLT